MQWVLDKGLILSFLANTPPKRGAEVISPPTPTPSTETDFKSEECQAELRLLDEETLQSGNESADTTVTAPGDNSLNHKQNQNIAGAAPPEPNPPSFRCQIVMAILAILALIPLICIVIYLVGMFWKVPSTLSMNDTSWHNKNLLY